jgi:uncharacterized protein (DUF111 family)
LRGVPLAELDVEGELTTPTGAAIVAALATDFGPLPPMTVDRIGYGAGEKDFPQANILRLLVGKAAMADRVPDANAPQQESIVVLETNVDNASGETLAHAAEQLWEAGALDVSLTSIQMKKGRPGVLLSLQCRPGDAARLESILFTELPTLGIRRCTMSRTALARHAHDVVTKWGTVEGKIAMLPNGTERFAPEFESCRRIADEKNITLADVMTAAIDAFYAK